MSRHACTICRHVTEDHGPVRADTVDGTEADQAVAGAHVQQRVGGLEFRCVEDPVADRRERLEHLSQSGFVPTEPVMEQPP